MEEKGPEIQFYVGLLAKIKILKDKTLGFMISENIMRTETLPESDNKNDKVWL